MQNKPYTDTDFRLIEINGVAEIPPSVSLDQFSDMFIQFIESHGWYFGGGYKDITEEEKSDGYEQ